MTTEIFPFLRHVFDAPWPDLTQVMEESGETVSVVLVLLRRGRK